MEITTAMLVNHAEIEGDKLFISGGGWAWLEVPALPQPVMLQVVLVVTSEPEEKIDDVLMRTFVIDPDGGATYGHELVVKWPTEAMLKPAQPIVMPVVMSMPFRATKPGRHSVAVYLDDDGLPRRQVPFAITLPA